MNDFNFSESTLSPEITIIVPKLDADHYQYKVLEELLKLKGVHATTVLEKNFIGSNSSSSKDMVIYVGIDQHFIAQKDSNGKDNDKGMHIGHNAHNAWIYKERSLGSDDTNFGCSLSKFQQDFDALRTSLGACADKVLPYDGDDVLSKIKDMTTTILTGLNPGVHLGLAMGYAYLLMKGEDKRTVANEFKEVEADLFKRHYAPLRFHYLYGIMWFVKNCLDDFLKENGYILNQPEGQD